MQSETSIVLATCNGARFLRHQIESLLQQSVRPKEIVALDDCSSDGTLEILGEYAKVSAVPFIVHVNNVRLGPTANFLSGISRCSGRYIAFCDQDDVWHPEKIELSERMLRSSGAAFVCHAVDLIDEHGIRVGSWSQGIILKGSRVFRVDPWANFLGMSFVFDRRFFSRFDHKRSLTIPSQHGGMGLSHDQWFDFLADITQQQVATKRALASYRLHHSNVSKVNKSLAELRVQLNVAAGFRASFGRQLPESAKARVEFLEDTIQSKIFDSPEELVALEQASRNWRKLYAIELMRRSLLSEPSFRRRAYQFARAVVSGGYRSWHSGGAGWGACIKDLLLSVFRLHPKATSATDV